jgi:hypothetical protein
MYRFLVALVLLAVVTTGTEAQAQNNWEVGLRAGDNVSIDGTIPFGYAPRLHAALYLDHAGLGVYGNWGFVARFMIGRGTFVKAD